MRSTAPATACCTCSRFDTSASNTPANPGNASAIRAGRISHRGRKRHSPLPESAPRSPDRYHSPRQSPAHSYHSIHAKITSRYQRTLTLSEKGSEYIYSISLQGSEKGIQGVKRGQSTFIPFLYMLALATEQCTLTPFHFLATEQCTLTPFHFSSPPGYILLTLERSGKWLGYTRCWMDTFLMDFIGSYAGPEPENGGEPRIWKKRLLTPSGRMPSFEC